MPPYTNDRPVFHLETCLRELWVLDTERTPHRYDAVEGLERHHGHRAYEFLLRIGCGLDSELKGESDVFGQLRDAWRAFESDHPVQASDLGSLIQRIFEDVKEIRSRHLRNLGSITYGGLARRLLGEDVGAPTLLVGAGRMAQAVIPYLSGQPLYVWNRSSGRTSQLLTALPAERVAPIQVLPADPGAEIDAWRRVTNVVLCVPANPRADAARLEAWAGPSVSAVESFTLDCSAPPGRLSRTCPALQRWRTCSPCRPATMPCATRNSPGRQAPAARRRACAASAAPCRWLTVGKTSASSPAPADLPFFVP